MGEEDGGILLGDLEQAGVSFVACMHAFWRLMVVALLLAQGVLLLFREYPSPTPAQDSGADSFWIGLRWEAYSGHFGGFWHFREFGGRAVHHTFVDRSAGLENLLDWWGGAWNFGPFSLHVP